MSLSQKTVEAMEESRREKKNVKKKEVEEEKVGRPIAVEKDCRNNGRGSERKKKERKNNLVSFLKIRTKMQNSK